MARYYFDFWEDGALAQDEVGVEFPDMETAKAQAISTLPSIAQSCLPQGDHKYLELRVRDESGRPVLKVSMAFVVEDLPGQPGFH